MQKQKRKRKNISSDNLLKSASTSQRHEVDGYYFDGTNSYVIRKDNRGKSTMELQAEEVQQGYQDNAEFKKKQIECLKKNLR